MHIRDLMITYFFTVFEQLVHDGHGHVLETPLFRGACARPPATGKSGTHQEKTIFCCSETERDNAVKELGGKPEITRFKGLGEISPKEFAQFIGKQMRLRSWRTATNRIRATRRVRADLRFLHGQEHAAAEDYIMDSLIAPVEESF